MSTISPIALPLSVPVRPWTDPVVEARGFPADSAYVEQVWLGILGPTATWAYRRLAAMAEQPDFQCDLTDLAVSLGVGEGLGNNSKLVGAMRRLVRYGVIRWRHDSLQVRLRLALVPEAQAQRLSLSARLAHEQAVSQQRHPSSDIQAGYL